MSNIDTKRVGRRILYCLSTGDASVIIQSRRNAGISHKQGNDPKAGQWFPGVIVADFGRTAAEHKALREKIEAGQYSNGDSELLERQLAQYDAGAALWAANVQVHLDGTDTYWATSRQLFDAEKMGYWRDPESGEKLPRLNVENAAPYDSAEWVPDPEGHWVFA